MYNSAISKNTKLIYLYIISTILLEIFFFLLMGFGFFPKYFWFDLCGILLMVSLLYLAHNFVAQSVVFWILYSLQTLLCVVNLVVKKGAGDLFSIDMLSMTKEGFRAFEKSFIDFFAISVVFTLYAIVIYIFVRICRYNDIKYVYSKKSIVRIFLYTLTFSFIGSSGYVLQSALINNKSNSTGFYVFESDKYLYNNLTSKTDAYKKFGTFGFYIKNISNFTSKEKITEEEKWDVAKYLVDAKFTPSTFFGVSEGNNVMTILLETMEYYAIDPYFTPNLYNIFFENNNTIKLNNFYANNRTNISEGLVLFGNYDKRYPVNLASDNVLDVFQKDVKFTLPSVLKDKGYVTRYYHDYCSWYYNRNITHPSAGFDYVTGLENMDLLENWVDFESDSKNSFYEWKNWTLDSDVVSAYFNEMTGQNDKKNTKFYTHFSLITMHGNHQQRNQLQDYYDKIISDKGNNNGAYDKMLQYVENMGYVIPDDEEMLEYFLWYKAAAMDVDKMLGILIDGLSQSKTGKFDKNGNEITLLDETTLVFFADHNCYYNGLAYEMRGLEYSSNTYDANLYKIPCVIYDKKLSEAYRNNGDSLSVDKFTSTYNLLPTVFDVLGIEYNPALYYGDSIFGAEINVFQSNISGAPYFTDRFILANNVIEWYKDGVDSKEEYLFKEGALKTFNRIQQINKIYHYPEILDMYLSLTS